METGKRIAVIDFDCYRLGREEVDENKFKTLADDIHKALTTVGFMYLINHGIPTDKINNTFAASKRFFELPEDHKMNYTGQADNKVSIHGFEETEKEQCCPERERDLKQCFNYTVKSATDDMWPDDRVPEFRQSMEEFYLWCAKLHNRILDLIACGLNLPLEFFRDLHKGLTTTANSTILRSLYYPSPDFEKVKDNQIRCGEHTDYGGITLLFQDKQGGLEVQDVEGDWISASPMENAVIVNLGDLMQRWTADKLIASVHRVIMPQTCEPRQSIVFFGHPDDSATITCTDGSNKYPPVNSLDFLEKRLYPTY